MDPNDPEHFLLVAKGFAYTRNVGHSFRGGVITPYSTTFDGGQTWTEGFLQSLDNPIADLPVIGPVGSTSHIESDPVVTFQPDGSILAITLPAAPPEFLTGLAAYRSTDGGRTFQALPPVVHDAPLSYDKQWVASDPVTGNSYIAVDGVHDFFRSTDGGQSWDVPGAYACCIYPALAVGPPVGPAGARNGTVYVAGGGGGSTVEFQRSDDQGQTWSPAKVVADTWDPEGAGFNGRLFRTPQIVEMAASHTDGTVVLVWGGFAADDPCRPVVGFPCAAPLDDIWFARSQDRGATWTTPVRINDDLPFVAFHFMPQVALSPNGEDVHVAWLDQRHDPTGLTAEAYYAHSPDGGRTWDSNMLLSDQPFPVFLSFHQDPADAQVFLGDYSGIAASDDRAVVSFVDTRYGRADLFIATIE